MMGDSELIITPNGCIYHLDLHPDEIAETIITVGDPDRVAKVSRYFDRIEVKKEHREFVTHTGYIGSKRITVLSTGIGPDNVEIVLNELDALVNIDFNSRTEKSHHTQLKIFRMGTSGSLQDDIEVDSLLVSSFGIGLDNMLHYYKHEYNAEEGFILNDFQNHTSLQGRPVEPYIAECSIQLLNHFTTNDFIHGVTLTCPGFYAPQGRRLRLPLAYPNLVEKAASFQSGAHRITNMEMETAAIYGLGKLLGHQCLSINNIINNRKAKTFSEDLPKAVDRMITTSLSLIEGI
jgi:uridine phosphorylase